MAYVAPTVRSVGDAVTAADYNIMANDVIDHETRIGDSGLVLVTPTSVSGTGMSVSGGQIYLSAVTTGTINGVFTSTYQTYDVVVSVSGTNNNQFCYLQLSTGGTASSTDYKSGVRAFDYLASNSTFDYTDGNVETRIIIGNPESSSVMQMFAKMTINNPAVATGSSFFGQSVGTASAVQNRAFIFAGQHRNVTSYDGLVITQSVGSVTGTIRVYGHTKS